MDVDGTQQISELARVIKAFKQKHANAGLETLSEKERELLQFIITARGDKSSKNTYLDIARDHYDELLAFSSYIDDLSGFAPSEMDVDSSRAEEKASKKRKKCRRKNEEEEEEEEEEHPAKRNTQDAVPQSDEHETEKYTAKELKKVSYHFSDQVMTVYILQSK